MKGGGEVVVVANERVSTPLRRLSRPPPELAGWLALNPKQKQAYNWFIVIRKNLYGLQKEMCSFKTS